MLLWVVTTALIQKTLEVSVCNVWEKFSRFSKFSETWHTLGRHIHTEKATNDLKYAVFWLKIMICGGLKVTTLPIPYFIKIWTRHAPSWCQESGNLFGKTLGKFCIPDMFLMFSKSLGGLWKCIYLHKSWKVFQIRKDEGQREVNEYSYNYSI